MTAVTIPQVRQALASAISANIPSLRSASTVPGAVNPPAAIVRPARGTVIEYHQSMATTGMDSAITMFMDVTVLVSVAHDRAGQNLLDGFLAESGPLSINAAIEKDYTLGGLISFAAVERAQGYGVIEWGGQQYLATTLVVMVAAP